MDEVILDGLSIETAMPPLETEADAFPHVMDVDMTDADSRAADTIDAICTMAELACAQPLVGSLAQTALASMASDPFFQQLCGMADKASS